MKGKYFDQIASGEKLEEYRLATPFWQKRLLNRSYDQIILTRGYPAKDDQSRRIQRPWRRCDIKTITHEHFGPDPVQVFAIQVN
jgi:hypothetical protein